MTILELRNAAHEAATKFSDDESEDGLADGLNADDYSRRAYLIYKASLDGIETNIVADSIEFSRWNGHFADAYNN